MTPTTFAEKVMRRDRAIVIAGLAGVLLLSWVYTIYLAQEMVGMPGMGSGGMDMHTGMGSGMSTGMSMEMAMPAVKPWGAMDYWLMFVMWVVMQVAMMTPSAAPMVLMYTTFSSHDHTTEETVWGTTLFYTGYLLIWVLFSVVFTLLQAGLHAAAMLSPMMETTSPILGGAILLTAGIYQFTPAKYACLTHCRTPLSYLMTEWREGKWGALMMGVRHGAFCVGCCWMLMAVLFVSGVMNLFWIAILTAYVLAEKVLPGGHKLGYGFGAMMIGWGIWMIAGVLV